MSSVKSKKPPRRSPPSRVRAEDIVKSIEIDLVCVVKGHSYCSRSKFHLPYPDVCLMTLCKLGDSMVSGHDDDDMIREIKQMVEQSSSSSLPVSSFIDMAKKLRDEKMTYPVQVNDGSIRTRCGSVNPKEQSTVTNQYFFGQTKTKYFQEGIFIVKFPESHASMQGTMPDMPPPSRQVQVQDISTETTPDGVSLLTRSPHGDNPTPFGNDEYLYKKTTDDQKRIIEFESQNPDKTVLGSVQFNLELMNLYEQRRLFCMSLNGKEESQCVKSCRGMDVMVLQDYYDRIVRWERRNASSAHDFFTQHDGIKDFMRNNGIRDEAKTREALLMLSEKRKQQVAKFDDDDDDPYQYDAQLVPSLYLQESCHDIVQKMHLIYPGRKILIILIGCRTTYDDDGIVDSEHEGEEELFDPGQGGARRNNKIKIKNTNQKRKKTCRKQTCRKQTCRKQNKSCVFKRRH